VPGAVYTFQTLNIRRRRVNQLLGINNAGVIAGYFGDGMVAAQPGLYADYSLGLHQRELSPVRADTVIGINNAEPVYGRQRRLLCRRER